MKQRNDIKKSIRGLALAPVFLGMAAVGMVSATQAELIGVETGVATKDLHVEQRHMAAVVNDSKARQTNNANVKVWVDRGDKTYAVGDKVKLSIKVDKTSYVTVFDTGTSGKVYQIFPNEHWKSNYIKAGQTVTIPGSKAGFDFIVGGPTGKELITVYATKKANALIDPNRLASAGAFKQVSGNGSSVSKDLQVVLRQEHQQSWEGANLELIVVGRK